MAVGRMCNGGSWTEPSVYAILALLAAGETAPAKRGIGWMLRTARPDGGWASRPGVGESSWVTALAALLPEECLAGRGAPAAIALAAGYARRRYHRNLCVTRASLRAIGIRRLRPSRLALDEGRRGVGGPDGRRADCAGARAAERARLRESRSAPTAGREFPAARTCARKADGTTARPALGVTIWSHTRKQPAWRSWRSAACALRKWSALSQRRRNVSDGAFRRCAKLAALGAWRAWAVATELPAAGRHSVPHGSRSRAELRSSTAEV